MYTYAINTYVCFLNTAKASLCVSVLCLLSAYVQIPYPGMKYCGRVDALKLLIRTKYIEMLNATYLPI